MTDDPRCTRPGVCYCTARPGCPDLDEDGQPWDDDPDAGWDDGAEPWPDDVYRPIETITPTGGVL